MSFILPPAIAKSTMPNFRQKNLPQLTRINIDEELSEVMWGGEVRSSCMFCAPPPYHLSKKSAIKHHNALKIQLLNFTYKFEQIS